MTDYSFQSPLGPRVMIAGRERDYFSGTSYLDLHNHPQVLRAAVEAIQQYGMSTGTSRGGYGEHPVYDALTAEVNTYFGTQQCLTFASGYLGALILAQGLAACSERLFIDEGSHFSVWDGARSTGKPLVPFRHMDHEHLASLLLRELRPGERPLVLTDGLFPISGELAPIPEYLDLAHRYGGCVAIDDAHAVGAIGPNGRGTLDTYGHASQCCYWCATLSKALGGYGGVIAGSQEQIENLLRGSRVFAGASPPPLPAAAAATTALRIARTEPQRRRRLWSNVSLARRGLRSLGWDLPDSPVPILCLRARKNLDLARLQQELFSKDLCVAHVTRYSSTPPGGALRIAIFASHSSEQIERLIYELGRLL